MFLLYINYINNVITSQITGTGCSVSRCNRQAQFTVAFYDISLILRSVAALFRQ